MPADLDRYKYGRWLVDRGWVLIPSQRPTGTACVTWWDKTIHMKPGAYRKPNVRITRYVLPHEIIHALHAETTGGTYECDDVQKFCGVDRKGAVEAIADAGCLMLGDSSAMRIWVRASVGWHSKVVGSKYSWATVVHPVTRNAVTRILQQVNL